MNTERITASIYRTNPTQVANLGVVAWEGMNFAAITAAAVHSYCMDMAARDGIIAPRICVRIARERACHAYDVEVGKDRHEATIQVDANSRDQAARIAERNGFVTRSVNMIG